MFCAKPRICSFDIKIRSKESMDLPQRKVLYQQQQLINVGKQSLESTAGHGLPRRMKGLKEQLRKVNEWAMLTLTEEHFET